MSNFIVSTQNGQKGEWRKLVAIAQVELVLEFNPGRLRQKKYKKKVKEVNPWCVLLPVETEGVQEGRETLHHQQDPNGQNWKHETYR